MGADRSLAFLYSEVMTFERKTFDSLNEDDIVALLKNKVAERRTLEYKAEVPGGTDADTREFLADASSFANTAGGYIVFGIQEAEGVPVSIRGLRNLEADEETLRLEAKIRTGVTPRIPAVRTKKIELANGHSVIVLKIPQSWSRPHMVTFKNASRFYARASNGKYQLDVTQIRDAFAFASSASQRLRDFRLERVSDVVALQTPVPLPETATVLLHSIPLGAFSSTGGSFDLSGPDVHAALGQVKPLYGSVNEQWHNFDGKVGVFLLRSGATSYVQLYRNGVLEAADTRILDDADSKQIRPIVLEKDVIVTVASMLRSGYALHSRLPHILWSADPPAAYVLDHL